MKGWTAPEVWQRVPQPLIDRPPARLFYDTPDKTNARVIAQHSLPLRAGQSDPEDLGMALATRIFGGGPGSRLWVRLRETGGLSYSAGAGYQASRYEVSATISLSAQVAPGMVSEAEAALKQELERSLQDGFTPAEVDAFKRQFLADRLRRRSGDDWAMSFMADRMEFNEAAEDYEKNDALIESLTTEQINAAWRRYVKPEKLVWAVFGDQAKIR